jgi:CheY-like chemotaxis protein
MVTNAWLVPWAGRRTRPAAGNADPLSRTRPDGNQPDPVGVGDTAAPPPVLLLVEDSESDIFFVRQILSKSKASVSLQVVTDGVEAVAYLSGSGRYTDRSAFPRPSLILMDLKLPKKSGLEILEWKKTQASLRDLPVFVLTSSNECGDVRAAYNQGASLYLVKPMGLDKLRALLQALLSYLAQVDSRPEKYLSEFNLPKPQVP